MSYDRVDATASARYADAANRAATQFVRDRLTAAGIPADTIGVTTRHMEITTGPRAHSLRTVVAFRDGQSIPDRLGDRIARILTDLPCYIDGHTTPDLVVAFWHGVT